MDYAAWEPTYREILADMGYDEARDHRAAERLDALLADVDPLPAAWLADRLSGRPAVIFGAAPDLDEDVGSFASYEGPTIAAGSATGPVLDAGIVPDLVVTDLDGDPKRQVEIHGESVPLAVHAHGDNGDRLERWVPDLDGPVLGTCQCDPEGLDRVRNLGGFTDGDRAACLAAHFGARKLILVGWDFDAASGDKLAKLRWARRIVEELPVPSDVV